MRSNSISNVSLFSPYIISFVVVDCCNHIRINEFEMKNLRKKHYIGDHYHYISLD